MPLIDIQKIQQQNIETQLAQLLELLRQTEEKMDLTQIPTAREELKVEVTRLKEQIEKYKVDLVELTIEMGQVVSAPARIAPIKSYRITIDESLPDTDADLMFKEEATSVLDLMNYEIDHAYISGAAPSVFLAVQEGDFEPTRAMFQCVHGIIDETIVTNFNGMFHSNKDHLRLTLGRIITNTYIAPKAIQLASQFRIGLLTFEDLLDKVLDVTRYLRFKCREYKETNKLYSNYVEVKYLRRGKGKFNDHKATAKEFLVAETPDGSGFEAKGELSPYVDQWAVKEGNSQICLLGDYGTGKTSFATQYFYKRASTYLQNPIKNRIPLLITLNRYYKSADIEEMITGFLANECNVRKNASFNNFLKVAERGKLLIILDGFDEMAKQVDLNVRRHNFSQIARLLVGHNKVILSGRPNYFLTLEEINNILGQPSPEGSPYDAALYKVTSEDKPHYEVLNIALFDRWQIQEFLEKQGAYLKEQGIADWRELEKTIYDTYNLEELARTPVLLEIIIKTIPEIRGKVTDINAADLYKIYTDFWLNRDYERGEVRWLITRHEKELFVLELAWQMLKSDNLSPEIHFSQLSENVRTFFVLEKANEIEYFSSDIRFCSYLVHSESDGNYKFIHKSFMEYFSARYIYNALFREQNVSKVFIDKPIPEEVFFFLCQIIKIEEIKILEDITRVELDELNKTYLLNLTSGLLNRAIELYDRRGDHGEASKYIDALSRYSNEFNFVRGKLQSLISQGNAYHISHRYESSKDIYDQALLLAKELGDRASECDVLIKLGTVAEWEGRYSDALSLCESALSISRELKDEVIESRILIQLGNIIQLQGRFNEARKFYEQALSKSRTLDDRLNQKEVLINIGRLQATERLYADALKTFHSALALARELVDRVSESNILHRMGNVYQQTDVYDEAEIYYQQALDVSLELNDKNSIGQVLYSLGSLKVDMSQYEEAKVILHKALQIAEELGDRRSLGVRLGKLGDIELKSKNYTGAEQLFLYAVRVFEELGDRIRVGRSHLNLANTYHAQHKLEQAKTYYESALIEFKRLNDRTSQAATLLHLGNLFKDAGEFLEAENSYLEAAKLNDARRDVVAEAQVLEKLGELKEAQHHFSEANVLYTRALDIWVRTSSRRSQAELYAKLGRVALRLGENQRAIELFSKHLDVARTIRITPDERIVQEYNRLTSAKKSIAFNWSTPVKEEARFFGRKQDVEELYRSIIEGQNILLIGERRMGKTSLLMQLQQRLHLPVIGVYVNLEVAFGRAETLLNEIIRRIISALIEAELISSKAWKNYSLTYISDFDNALGSILREAKEKLPSVNLALILDEAEAIIETQGQVEHVLRASLQGNDGVVAVLAGTSSLLAHMDTSNTSPLFNIFKILVLQPLSEEESARLITETAKQAGIKFTSYAIARIYELCGGSPWGVQMICQQLVRLGEDAGDAIIDIQDVDDIIPDLLQSGTHIYKHKWDELGKREKSVLRLILGKKLIRKENLNALNNLKNQHIIEEVHGEYFMREKLFEKWLRYNSIIKA